MGRLRKILFSTALVLFFVPTRLFSQELINYDNNYGFNVGLNVAFGTHLQRLGVNLNFYYLNNFFQANTELRFYYSFKNLGPKFINPELVLAQGFVFGYGSKQTLYNPFLNSISNQTRYTNSIAYSYNAYFNTIQTDQQTGIVAFQFDKITVISENDLLAKPALDRFRTAAFLLQYQYEDKYQAAINCTMWTGKMGSKSGIINPHFYYECFMDTAKGVYVHTSHGLLSAQVKYNVGLSQNVQANVGIDAEQVRNAVQNKFIHDMRWIPKKWNKARNCHIPMMDRNGNPYFYQEDQKVRKPKPFINVFSNANVFY